MNISLFGICCYRRVVARKLGKLLWSAWACFGPFFVLGLVSDKKFTLIINEVIYSSLYTINPSLQTLKMR